MLKVNLIAYTPNPDKLVASAAKLCYSPVGVEEIQENLSNEEVQKFLTILMNLGHESPIEHVNFTFGVEGVSRSLTHQLVRHRIASYSQQSQRYVKLDHFEYIIPKDIEDIPEAKDIYIKSMEKDQKAYDDLFNILFPKYYDYLISKGYSEKRASSMAEKMAIENARYVFPNACETKIVFTMNARTLLNFFHKRTCNRAQWEIRDLALEMLKLVKEVAPITFKNAGKPCLSGYCGEGAMQCPELKGIISVRK